MFKVEDDFISFEENLTRVNTGAINYYEMDITFNESWNDLTKVAILVNRSTKQAIEIPVILDKIFLPFLEDESVYNLGVIGYTITNNEKSLQISTNLIPFYVDLGAGSITTTEQEVPETSIWEQYVDTMNGILEDTDDIRNATNLIKSETEQIKDDTDLIKTDVISLKNETKGYKDETEGLKNSTADIKDDVEDLRDETLGYKNEAKDSADNAKISEDNAKDSEEDAELALSDLLAMLGTSVATLTGGKLTPSQIPDLSINDVFTVTDTDEMLLLTAERGDVAIIVPEDVVTDSYILSADDPTILSNWKKLGVSYVANAGHATTADNATDSEKINGKRIVGMTETQYASAVLDENTYYLVYPD